MNQTNMFQESTRRGRDELAWRDQVADEHAALTRFMELNPRRRSHPYKVQPMPSQHWVKRMLRAIWKWC